MYFNAISDLFAHFRQKVTYQKLLIVKGEIRPPYEKAAEQGEIRTRLRGFSFGNLRLKRQIIMQIKFTAVILLIFCMHVNAKSYAQINLKENNESLTRIFKHIGNQSGYNFLFSYELLQQAGKTTVHLTNASLKEAMTACLAGKELAYTIVGKTIIIKKIRKRRSLRRQWLYLHRSLLAVAWSIPWVTP